MPIHYSDEQIKTAKRLQKEYMQEVTAAWMELEDAARRKTERINEAERVRNLALRVNGVALDDLGRLAIEFRD